MDIYSKIDKMFQKDITQEVLDELKELKDYVKRGVKVVGIDKVKEIQQPQKILKPQSQKKNKQANLSKEFINFMKTFKQKYRAKKRYNFYIEFEYKGKILSLNEKGLICDERGVLPTYKALEVFEYLYKNRLNMIEEKEEIF